MEEPDVMEIDHMECDVCGERTFQEREGYYYCIECGTKKEQLRAVEISAEDTFNDTSKHVSQRTIKKPKVKAEENDITSWEFFNYVLRGFLDELLNMGAKPELKLMTLQVWAAYMARMEVAFNKNNEMGLPKLNVRALARDAHIIYNYKKIKRKRERQDKQLQAPEIGDERANWREWRKTKRKLDESGYKGKKGAQSESTLQTNQSLQLQWSVNARKCMKKQMPLKHLDKHSLDSSGSMLCHGLRPKASLLCNFDRNIYCLNIIKLYTVLAIALNQIEDDIQLTDLIRFVNEEHLTSRYMLSYLPENVAIHGKTLVKQMELNHQRDKCGYKFLRAQISHMSRFIDMNGFQKPDLEALTKRYVLELDLPPVIASYVSSLMDVLPPAFEPNFGIHVYPRYEARVMAYIIYVMKLLFGLDDVKERAISESAMLINKELLKPTDEHTEQVQPLFVYTEWMQFVELRKVLVSHYSESFAQRFRVTTGNGRKVNDFLNKERKQKEHEYNHIEMQITPAMQRIHENISLIFETLLKDKFGESSSESFMKDHIEFQPSLTPAHSYFKRILLHASQAEEGEMSVQIPDFMKIDHTERQLEPFKYQTAELAQHLAVRGKTLRVEELAVQKEYEEIGIFQMLARPTIRHREWRANCEITTQNWLDELRRREKRPKFEFRRPVATYGRQYQNKMMERAVRRQALERDNPFWKLRDTPNYILTIDNEDVSLNSLASIQTFDEDNMDPLRVPLKMPRRQVRPMSQETTASAQPKSEEPIREEEDITGEQELLLKISNFDCWLLHGYITRMKDSSKQKLRSIFPCSFRWLLETCAATLGVEWDVVYEQLLVLEVVFHHGIEDWSCHSNHLRLKYNILNKDINLLTKSFRDMW
ncbi:PREDICTED: TATA box-binding protein-associated factor RNA polymerase I subunit B [Drosophila arizonae]|uniref:TATA box-binding protein-associated factor RNA polymerase I subunit B n=1 Tax=Drosophila arizonae TaxID=7263 RepID=A0ABM1PT40_DROAR|nr:PREDICTED: TATA box-binding protein-associated factor RNA polymerase I subunit B [Drosophila arizonae]